MSQPVLPSDDRKWKRLAGDYATFFNPAAHEKVERWYNTIATQQERHLMKSLVKQILSFDMTKAKSELEPTHAPAIAAANAVWKHHGKSLTSARASVKCVEWLSIARPSLVDSYRAVFSSMDRPPNFGGLCTTETLFNPARCYVEVPESLVPKQKLVAAEHDVAPSHVWELPNNAKGKSRTTHLQTFSWKSTPVPLAFSERARDRLEEHQQQAARNEALVQSVQAHEKSGVTTDFVLPNHLTHSASSSLGTKKLSTTRTPYGTLEVGSDPDHWTSVTHDVFSDTYFLMPPQERRHQNFNDNYSRLAYFVHKQQRRAAPGSKSQPPPPAAARQQVATPDARSLLPSPKSQHPSKLTVRVPPRLAASAGTSPAISLDDWLLQKSKRPISVVFPSL